MAGKPSIAIVGPGRLGTGLAMALAQAGYPVVEVLSRKSAGSLRRAQALARKLRPTAAVLGGAQLKADVVWLCVPDAEIASVARQLAGKGDWKGKIALHPSGALSSDELEALRGCGAAVGSAHPMMTFVRGTMPSLQGVPWGLEGDAGAVRVVRRMVRDLGGEVFRLSKAAKPLYHAWGAFLSPLVVAELVTSEQVARAAGISAREARKRMLPIVRQTFLNYAALGPAGAFSGPLVRGDAEVVDKHLRALRKVPEARAVYLVLARAALRHLPAQNRERLRKMLGA